MYCLDRQEIEEAMKARGISSIQQLAAVVGLHRNTVQGYFVGRGVVSNNLEKMLDFLQLELSKVLVHHKSRSQQDALVANIVDSLATGFPNWTFVMCGSRASQKHSKYADLDIGVFSAKGIEHKEFRRLLRKKSEIEESQPIFVDVANLNRADDDFLQSIAHNWAFLTGKRQDWLMLQEKVSKYKK